MHLYILQLQDKIETLRVKTTSNTMNVDKGRVMRTTGAITGGARVVAAVATHCGRYA